MPKLPEKSPPPFLFSQLDEMKKSSYFLFRPNTKIEIKKGTGNALEVVENRQAIFCPYTVCTRGGEDLRGLGARGGGLLHWGREGRGRGGWRGEVGRGGGKVSSEV